MSSTRTRGPRPAVTRDEIVAAGLAIADAEGIDALSMRRVAQALGVGTMTLYTHVAGKDELLDLMHDEAMAEVVVPGELPAEWREALALLARRTMEAAIRHEWVLSHRSGAHIGPNALRHVEQSIAAVEPLGLTQPVASAVLASVDDYAMGYAMRAIATRRWQEATGETDPVRADRHPEQLRRMLDSGDYPHLRRSLEKGDFAPPEERFEMGLAWLLDGIAAELARSRGNT